MNLEQTFEIPKVPSLTRLAPLIHNGHLHKEYMELTFQIPKLAPLIPMVPLLAPFIPKLAPLIPKVPMLAPFIPKTPCVNEFGANF